jgi:hypothetical protein
MSSKLDVVNQVLSEIGRPPVASIANTDDASLIISPRVDLLSQELLLRTQWNFAVIYKQDTTPLPVSISPDFPWTYQLPANFGSFAQTSPQNPNFGLYYRFINNYICTIANPIQYYYIVNQVDYTVITPLFSRALVLYTASDVCLSLTQNAQLTRYLKDKYMEKLDDALKQNDQQRYIQSTPYNDFNRSTYI